MDAGEPVEVNAQRATLLLLLVPPVESLVLVLVLVLVRTFNTRSGPSNSRENKTRGNLHFP